MEKIKKTIISTFNDDKFTIIKYDNIINNNENINNKNIDEKNIINVNNMKFKKITLLNYLKKCPNADIKFIDDFFEFYDINNPCDFNVDLDKVHNWLECKKDGLRQTLFNTYTKNIDYKILKPEKHKTVGKQLQKIMLTSLLSIRQFAR